MGKAQHIAGLDIGSASVKIALLEEKNDGTYAVLAAAAVETPGIRKGAVSDIEAVGHAIKVARTQIRKNTGVDVRNAVVGIGDSRLSTHNTSGLIAISRADGQIVESDIERAGAAAEESLPRLQNRHILHMFPTAYRVDGDQPVRDPIGMNGMKLEIDALFISAFMPHFRSVQDAVEAGGVRPDDIAVGHLASAHLLLTKKQREIGVMLFDLGAETTTIGVWEEGALMSFEVLPIGSAHITNDIALGFQIGVDAAERLKRSYITLLEGGKKELRLSGFDKSLETTFSARKLEDIVGARLGDIFELTAKHLKKIGRSGLLPAGVVLTGGGSRLAGIADVARQELQLPVVMGTLTGFTGKRELVDGPEWVSVLGLCTWGQIPEGGAAPIVSGKLSRSLRRFIRTLIP